MNLANKIELVPIANLRPYESNARLHSADQIAKLQKSIKEFGFTNPILVDKTRGIIAGHGRLAAAKAMGMERVPVIVLDYLSDTQKRALVLADNRLAEDARWDADLLKQELEALDAMDFDLDLVGFSDAELDGLLKGEDLREVLPAEPRFTEPAPARERREAEEAAAAAEPAEDIYTKKITAPIYEPKGERPNLESLFDSAKAEALSAEIDNADIPGDVKGFLRMAADRHTVFDYEKIAEFYAHAEPEVQALMERSALVIIDFEKAIENGFVQMTKEIAEAYPSGDAEE